MSGNEINIQEEDLIFEIIEQGDERGIATENIQTDQPNILI